MKRAYWENIAPEYDEEIFDVLAQDKKGLIKKEVLKVAGADKSIIDIGCAVGKWLPVLSSAFKKVHAVDISAKNISIAKKSYADLKNVSYQRADMSSSTPPFSGYDVALCVNAILSESLMKRQRFFYNINKSIKKDGHLILVVPALESWLLTRIIQHQWKIDKKLFQQKLPTVEAAKRYADIQQGNVEIDDVATKHYLGDELDLLLSRSGFEVITRKKINYDWNTEFIETPTWLQQPQPWDWMTVARRTK
jgi:2-polyprenyl-3-methyl-5-hydroxy-6-metoxy-1,4-benzoquinol methylase